MVADHQGREDPGVECRIFARVHATCGHAFQCRLVALPGGLLRCGDIAAIEGSSDGLRAIRPHPSVTQRRLAGTRVLPLDAKLKAGSG
jgi:hypothetical protein